MWSSWRSNCVLDIGCDLKAVFRSKTRLLPIRLDNFLLFLSSAFRSDNLHESVHLKTFRRRRVDLDSSSRRKRTTGIIDNRKDFFPQTATKDGRFINQNEDQPEYTAPPSMQYESENRDTKTAVRALASNHSCLEVSRPPRENFGCFRDKLSQINNNLAMRKA